MKAILVLDEVPKSCVSCPIACYYVKRNPLYQHEEECFWCSPINDNVTQYTNCIHPKCQLVILNDEEDLLIRHMGELGPLYYQRLEARKKQAEMERALNVMDDGVWDPYHK